MAGSSKPPMKDALKTFPTEAGPKLIFGQWLDSDTWVAVRDNWVQTSKPLATRVWGWCNTVLSEAMTTHYTISDMVSCRHEKVSDTVWMATSRDWNKSFKHTEHRTDWPRGIGQHNTSPHFWILTSVSVDSSPRSYPSLLPLRSEYRFTLRRIPIR